MPENVCIKFFIQIFLYSLPFVENTLNLLRGCIGCYVKILWFLVEYEISDASADYVGFKSVFNQRFDCENGIGGNRVFVDVMN